MSISNAQELDGSLSGDGEIARVSSLLAKVARTDLYRSNSFRITGISVRASQRDVTRHIQQQEIKEKLGSGTTSVGPLSQSPLPTGEQLREATQRLRDPERRLLDEFFWFWPVGQARLEDVIASISPGGMGEVETWLRQDDSELDDEFGVDTHNFAVLAHAAALDLEYYARSNALNEIQTRRRDLCWREAYRRWTSLIEIECFWESFAARVLELNDPRLQPRFADNLRSCLPEALLAISAQLAAEGAESGDSKGVQRHVNLMRRSSFGGVAVNDALRRVSRPVRERLKALCNAAEREASADPSKADQVTRRLLEQAELHLNVLAALLPAGDLIYEDASDEVALSANLCQFHYGRETNNWRVVRELLELALHIAASDSVISRLEENLKTTKNNEGYQKLESYFNDIKKVTDSDKTPKGKLEELKKKFVPQLESFKGEAEDDPEVFAAASDILARAFRSVSIDLHNEAEEFGLAHEAITLAGSLCKDPELKDQIKKDTALIIEHLDQAKVFKDLKPINSAPSLHTVNGIGTTLYGTSDFDSRTNSYLTTLYIVFLAIPLFPIARYRVILTGRGSYRFLGKVPFRKADKWHLAAFTTLVVGFFAAIILNQPSPVTSSNAGYSGNSTSYPAATPFSYAGNNKSGANPPRNVVTNTRGRPSPSPQAVNSRNSASGEASTMEATPTEPVNSYNRSRASQLKNEIEAAKSSISSLESDLGSMSTELDSYERRITADSAYLKSAQETSEAGGYVDRSEYRRVLEEHNSYVRTYNSMLADYRAKRAKYKVLLDDHNAKVDEYNRLIRGQ